MRLNFQQQRAINPSAPANTFIAEREAPGMNQFAMQRQIIEEATNALQDTAKATAIVAKANQQAKDADFKGDFADLRVKLNKVQKEIEFGYESNQEFEVSHLSLQKDENGKHENNYRLKVPTNKAGHFGYSQVDNNKEQTRDWLKRTVLKDFEGADKKYIRAVEREVDFTIENAFASAKKSSLKHTKNYLTDQLNKENEQVAGDISRSKDLKFIANQIQTRFDSISTDLDGTFTPKDIAAKQSKFVENAVTELAYRLTGPDSTEADKKSYQAFYTDAASGKGMFKNVDPLFLARLHRDAGARVFNTQKSDDLALARYSLQYDAENFFMIGGVTPQFNEVDGVIVGTWKKRQKKNKDGKMIDDPNWASSYKSLFPKLTENEITTLLNSGIKELEKIENDKFKKTQFKGTARVNFNSKLTDYIRFWEEAWVTDSQGLRKTNSTPPSPPWMDAPFKGEEWSNYKQNLLKLDSLFRGADAGYALSKSPDSTPEQIQEQVDELLEKVESIPAESEGIRSSAFNFYNKVNPFFQKQIKRASNATNQGENNVNRICEQNGISPVGMECFVEGIKQM